METIVDQLRQLRAERRRTIKALSGLTEGQLTRSAGTEDRPGEVRLHLIGLAGADDARRTTLGAIFAALGWQQTEAQRILASAAEARGLLRASLIGLTEADLDKPPAAEEWAVRQVLGHVLNVEQATSCRPPTLPSAPAIRRCHHRCPKIACRPAFQTLPWPAAWMTSSANWTRPASRCSPP